MYSLSSAVTLVSLFTQRILNASVNSGSVCVFICFMQTSLLDDIRDSTSNSWRHGAVATGVGLSSPCCQAASQVAAVASMFYGEQAESASSKIKVGFLIRVTQKCIRKKRPNTV
jgi:hypothetical protein